MSHPHPADSLERRHARVSHPCALVRTATGIVQLAMAPMVPTVFVHASDVKKPPELLLLLPAPAPAPAPAPDEEPEDPPLEESDEEEEELLPVELLLAAAAGLGVEVEEEKGRAGMLERRRWDAAKGSGRRVAVAVALLAAARLMVGAAALMTFMVG